MKISGWPRKAEQETSCMQIFCTHVGIYLRDLVAFTMPGPKAIVIGVFTLVHSSISYMKIDKDQVECFQCKYARGTKSHKI